jgi:hypothetical protein
MPFLVPFQSASQRPLHAIFRSVRIPASIEGRFARCASEHPVCRNNLGPRCLEQSYRMVALKRMIATLDNTKKSL